MGKVKLGKQCKTCNKEYTLTNFKKYCSEYCYGTRINAHDRGGSIVKNCDWCNERVLKFESEIKNNLDGKIFCNNICGNKHHFANHEIVDKIKNEVNLICTECKIEFIRLKSHVKITNKNNFCSTKCANKFQGRILGRSSKNSGTSKLEAFITQKIELNFPYIKILKGDREILDGLEIDIYFVDFKFGMEINGPVHSKPIFGKKYFENVQKRDGRKIILCKKLNINLFILQNLKTFSLMYGEYVWKTIVKPRLINMIPFCEPPQEEELIFVPPPKKRRNFSKIK